jgi:hypothetical protein
MKQLQILLLSVGLAGLIMVGLMTLQAPQTAQALPPRPTVVPPDAAQPEVTGGFITLVIDGTMNEMWTAVQWQDHNNSWHLVDGWQGTPNADNDVRWYVGQANLGSGPFRWLVYDAPDGNLLATSEAFMLPEHARQTVTISVALP